jgi:hypothetical protein
MSLYNYSKYKIVVAHPERLIISYKIRASKVMENVPVSFGYTDAAETDGTGHFASGRFQWTKDTIVLQDVTIRWEDFDEEAKENLLPKSVTLSGTDVFHYPDELENTAEPTEIYIDATGIFTGTLSANTVNAININASQITAGTINAARIDVVSLKASLITAANIEALTIIRNTNRNVNNATVKIFRN